MSDDDRPTVLVVDDSPENLKLISGLLKGLYRVKVTNAGANALAIATSPMPPDLILLDIMMPEMDGYEVCRRLKAGRATRDIPVIFLTAMTAIEDEELGLKLGAVDYISKPISPPLLLARVATHLKTQQLLKIIRQDLNAANLMQQAILPRGGIDAPSHALEATMTAARDVGGDFYDYFYLPDRRLAVVIADVSGKGMAAALFMAVSRTVIRATAMMTDGPAACLSKANAILSADNDMLMDMLMFVTVFYGVLDLESGRLCYANGGHNPPYHLSAQGVTALPATGNLALGVVDDAQYEEKCVDLAAGDLLFLYTDGITEAFDLDQQEFGTDRLHDVLQTIRFHGGLAEVVGAVEAFTGEASQSDDMTCMLVRWGTPPSANTGDP